MSGEPVKLEYEGKSERQGHSLMGKLSLVITVVVAAVMALQWAGVLGHWLGDDAVTFSFVCILVGSGWSVAAFIESLTRGRAILFPVISLLFFTVCWVATFVTVMSHILSGMC